MIFLINRAIGGGASYPMQHPRKCLHMLFLHKAENLSDRSEKKSMQQLCHGGACLNNPAR